MRLITHSGYFFKHAVCSLFLKTITTRENAVDRDED